MIGSIGAAGRKTKTIIESDAAKTVRAAEQRQRTEVLYKLSRLYFANHFECIVSGFLYILLYTYLGNSGAPFTLELPNKLIIYLFVIFLGRLLDPLSMRTMPVQILIPQE